MAGDAKSKIDQAAERAKSATDAAATAAKTATDQMREGAAKGQQSFAEHVVDPAKRAGEAMRASGEKFVQGGSTIGMTMIEQAERNAREAFAAMREAAAAKDLSDVIKIQGDFLREQGQRSMAQAREISELIVQFGKDAIAPIKGGDSK